MNRKLFNSLSAATLGFCLLLQFGCATARQNRSSLTKLSVIDSHKQSVHPFSHQDQATVFIFVATECPVSNKYAPEVSRLYSKFKDSHMAFYLVYPNIDDIPEMIQSHTKDYGYAMPALYDPQHKLVGPSKVRVTPEAAVFSKDGTLVYHGRIDDRFPSLGVARPQSSVHDLDGILQALSEGKTVVPTETKAIGCYIPQ
jgi:thiol-disulfide isomerase/thioredoxin